MAQNETDHNTFRHYLLGQLTGDDLEAFEKRLLTDDEAFEELLALEAELVDEYASNQLSPTERAVFEKHFLITPERRDDLEFARTLRRFVQQKNRFRLGWPNFEATRTWIVRVGVAIAIGLFGLFAFLVPRSAQTVATVTLTPIVSTRAEGPQPTKVSLGEAEALKLLLKLPEGALPGSRYRAELNKDTGEVKAVDATVADQETVSVQIPATDLTPGRYSVKLYAINTGGSEQRVPGSYFFSLE